MPINILRIGKRPAIVMQFVPHLKYKRFVWKYDMWVNNTYIKILWLSIIYKHK